MGVLLATDFLASSVMARTLVLSLPWPRTTRIEILYVLPTRKTGLFQTVQVPDPEVVASAQTEACSFAREVSTVGSEHGFVVHALTRVGDPAAQIAERARELDADLIVIGSSSWRQGTDAAGAVESAVVDDAPCPVLIARTSQIESLLLADDGSRAADAAAAITLWPIFASLSLTIVSVVPHQIPVMSGHRDFAYTFEGTSRVDLAHADVARRVSGLSLSRTLITGLVREGDPAEQILEVGKARSADLIIVGASHRSPLSRVLLGSVTRTVIRKFRGSVLVARSLDSAPARRHLQVHQFPGAR